MSSLLIAGLSLMAVGTIPFIWYVFTAERRKLEAVRNTATVSVAEAARAGGGAGRTFELSGTVECEDPLEHPCGGDSCVYYRVTIEERHSSSKGSDDWITVVDDERSAPFAVMDGSGRISVSPDGADFRVDPERENVPGIGGYDYLSEGIEEKKFSKNEVAKILLYPPDAVKDWIKQGLLEKGRGGVNRRQLEEFLREHGELGSPDVFERMSEIEDDYYGQKYRMSSWLVPVGSEVYLLGGVEETLAGPSVVKGRGPFLISAKPEAELVESIQKKMRGIMIFGAILFTLGVILAMISIIT